MDLKEEGPNLRLLVCNACSESYPLPRFGTPSAHAHTCPICQFQVVAFLNEKEDGSTYTTTCCPYCYNNPPADQAAAAPGGFKCNNCSFASWFEFEKECSMCLRVQ
jgi:hypothetical protein